MRYVYDVSVDFGLYTRAYLIEAGSVARAAVLGNKVARREYNDRGGRRKFDKVPRILTVSERGNVDARG